MKNRCWRYAFPVMVLVTLVGVLVWPGHHPPVAQAQVHPATTETILPPEIFSTGNRIHGLGSTYYIEEVQGGWIKASLYHSLDKNPAPATEPRWIYIPASAGPWTLAKAK